MGCCNNLKTDENHNDDKHQKLKNPISQNKNTDVRKNYEFISMLDNGSYGKVRLYRDINYKYLLFAIKTLKKEAVYQFNLLKSEVVI